MSDHDMIRRGDAYGEFPDDWRDRAHGFKGTFKMQAAWSDGFNACRKSIAALPAADPLVDPRVQALVEALKAVAQHEVSIFWGPDAEKNERASWRGVMRKVKAALAYVEGSKT
jgi:hypothetical protein